MVVVQRVRGVTSLVSSGVVALAVVLGAIDGAGAEPAGDPVPSQTVTVTVEEDPYYGDPVRLLVDASGGDSWATVYQGTKQVSGPVLLSNLGKTTISIPTLDTYFPETTYSLRVAVSNDESSGSQSASFTPRRIPATVKIASTTTYRGSPLYGVLEPAVPTSVEPTGTMVAFRGFDSVGSVAIRRDRTFGIYSTDLGVGAHRDVSVGYTGDPYFTDPFSSPVDLTVLRAPTQVVASLSSTSIEQGEQLDLNMTVNRSADSRATFAGQVRYRISSYSTSVESISRTVDYPAAGSLLQVPLQEWAGTHPGVWYASVDYLPSEGTAASSLTTVPFEVRLPGVVTASTTTTLDILRKTHPEPGDPVTVVAKVATETGAPATSGEVVFSHHTESGGWSVRAAVGPDGSATAQIDVPDAGLHRLIASYTGAPGFGVSQSAPAEVAARARATLTVLPTGVTGPEAGQSARYAVEVRADGLVPVGAVVARKDGRTIATAQLEQGAAALTLPGLPAGRHSVQITYEGDASTQPATEIVALVVRESTGQSPTKRTSVTTLAVPTNVSLGSPLTASVGVAVETGVTPDGQVQLVVDGTVVATERASASTSMVVPLAALTRIGPHTVAARYTGSVTQSASESAARSVSVVDERLQPRPGQKASSTVSVKVKKRLRGKVRILATISSAGTVAGRVQVVRTIKVGRKTRMKVIARGIIKKPGTRAVVALTTKRLPRGIHRVTVRYLGSPTVTASARSLRIRTG